MSSSDPGKSNVSATAIASPGAPWRTALQSNSLRRALKSLRAVVTVVLLLTALFLCALRLSLPMVENYRPEVQAWVSHLLARPATIETLSAHWRGWTPELDITGLKLLRDDTLGVRGESALTFERVQISIDLLNSLRSWSLAPNSIVLGGASLAVKVGADGAMFVAGMRAAQQSTPADIADDIAHWLLRDGRLIFDSATVSWIDERRGETPLLLTNVRVDLLNQGGTHRLRGSFRLPGVSQERVDFLFDASGDLRTSDWTGQLLLSGNGIDVSRLKGVYAPVADWIVSGRSDISFWGTWNGGSLDRTKTQIKADGLLLAKSLGSLRINGGSAELRTGFLDNGLSVDIALSELYTSEGRWPDTRGSINYLSPSEFSPSRLVGRFDRARLADLVTLLKAQSPALFERAGLLARYRSNADLEDLHFALSPGEGGKDSIELTADFENLSIFEAANRPSLSGFSGRVEINGKHGVVALNQGVIDVAMAEMFNGRFLVATQGGRVSWQQLEASPRVDAYNIGFSTPELSGQFTGSAQWDQEHSAPLVSVIASLTSEDVAGLRRYIPTGALKPRLVEWLRRSIVGGRVTRGNLLIHGRAEDFPFDDGNGILEAQFTVTDGVLDYAPGWPSISGLSGELRFAGREIQASVEGGRIFDADIDTADVSLSDLGRGAAVVKIQGAASGNASDGLAFIKESPLRSRFENQLANISVGGPIRLRLSMALPLDQSETQLDGTVALGGNTIDLPQLETGLKQVAGNLEFDQKGFRARDVGAVYLERPVTLEVLTTNEGPRNTEIRISGKADNRYVARHLVNAGVRTESGIDPTSWLARLKGEAPWLAVVEVPTAGKGERRDILLRLESGLNGMQVDFPYPVGKAANESGRLSVAVNISDPERRRIRMRYGKHADAVLEMEREDGALRFQRGSLVFGGEKSALREQKGLYIGGRLTELVAGDWVETWRSALKPEDPGDEQRPGLERINLDVSRLVLLGSSFQDVRIDVSQAENGTWKTRFSGEGLKGGVTVPRNWKSEPVVADFDRIDYWSAGLRSDKVITDPRSIPPIQFTSRQMNFDGRDLGLVKLVASRFEGGLDFETILLISDSFEANAAGRWHYGDRGHRSEFSLAVHSKDLGNFLSNLGFGDTNADGGTTDIMIDANWAAAPMDFELAKLSGVLHFRSSKGKLLGIERGTTGRVFGLLTVTTLPQRLSLDFTDLFEKGVSYERLEGSFSLEKGQAYTNNLMMETSTARVDIAGRTGLLTEDYDQVMTVTPRLSSSLPLAPIWLAEKFLNRRLFDKAFSYKYFITGPWDNPTIERQEVEANPAEKG